MPIHKIPTLPSLIKQQMKNKGLSRPDLVSALGYTNISKGCRKLDQYLTTLEAPSNEFISTLLTALDIDGWSFYQSLSASLDKISDNTEKTFKPYIRVLLGIQIRPAIAWQIVHNRCHLLVPKNLPNKPYRDEINAVIALYQDHMETGLGENLKNHVIGFEYHRKHDHYLRFNTDLVLKKTVYVQPIPQVKIPLANKVAGMLSGGAI